MRRRLNPKKVFTKAQSQNLMVDYKNVSLLQKFLNERGKMLSRRFSGVSAKTQRQVASAVKRARFLALLPSGGVMK